VNLRRIRWAVRGVLLLGVAASVVANVLHAKENLVSQTIAAWPPIALLLTVELISRVPVHRLWLAIGRWVATATLAGIAAWISYWHMAGVATKYGETGAAPYLIPFSVDGLIVVASICLVELSGQLATADKNGQPGGHADGQPGGHADGQPGGHADGQPGGHADGQPGGHAQALATEMAKYTWPPLATPAGVANLSDYQQHMATAPRPEAGVGEEAEAYLAAMHGPRPAPLPRRGGPAAGPAPIVPAEARELLAAWDGSTPAAKEVDQLLAAHFGKGERTVRRWRTTLLGPASGPPLI
jgi:hypothetical protein